MTSPTDHGLEQDAITLGGINLAFWLASLGLGKTWPVDFIWSCFPPLLCLLIIVREPDAGVCERRIVGCTLVATWGFRLTHNFVSRGGVGHEDWRYSDMRRTFGRHFWWVSLFSVFLGQAAFLFSACMSLYGVLCAPDSLTATDAAGAAVCFGAVLLEAASDLQMDAFVAARREHRTDATVIDRGLWMWSRHPNYLGLCSFGPVSMTFLFVCVSIKLMEDRHRGSKGEAWIEYTRAVPSPLLLVPPPINRRLGHWLHAAESGEAARSPLNGGG